MPLPIDSLCETWVKRQIGGTKIIKKAVSAHADFQDTGDDRILYVGEIMMKVLFTTLLACALCTGVAWAAEGDYVIKDGNVYRMDGGKEKRMEEDVHSTLTEKGAYSWILVDPKLSEEMKGSEAGIYLLKGQENTPAGFIPMEDAGICQL